MPDVRHALILKADRFSAEFLRRTVASIAPRAHIVVTHSLGAAALALSEIAFDLVLAGVESGLHGDVLQLLADCTAATGHSRRVFVVGSDIEHRVLTTLQSLPIRGVFDCGTETPDEFTLALRAVLAGERYWSRSLTERLRRDQGGTTAEFQHLSKTEQLVLSLIGDGSDDLTAARALGLSPATVSTIRRKLHRKLRVQHRGELIRIAAENGYVRFTPSGIVRPGFALLAAECLSRKRKRRASAEAAMTAFLLLQSA